MNKLILLLTLYFFVQPPAANAQRRTRGGFIVTTNNDTLRGELRSKNWRRTPTEIRFRQNAAEDFVTYDTGSIVYFVAGNDRYIRAIVTREISSLDYAYDGGEMLNPLNAPVKRQRLFLKRLVAGSRYDLLEVKEFERTNYYLKDSDGNIIDLSYKVERNSSGNILRYFLFRQTLRTINAKHNNDPAIDAAINMAGYDGASLSRIVTKLNQAPSAITENHNNNTTCQVKPNNPAHCFFFGYGKDG